MDSSSDDDDGGRISFLKKKNPSIIPKVRPDGSTCLHMCYMSGSKCVHMCYSMDGFNSIWVYPVILVITLFE